MNNLIWKGVLVEESLTDTAIFPKLTIVQTETALLERQASKGTFHFHKVEVLDNAFDEVITYISSHIHDGWYFHLVNNGTIIVVFRNKIFRANKKGVGEIQTYGVSQGILKEQMNFEHLIDHPYD